MEHKIKNLPKSQIELEITITAQEMKIFWQMAKKKVSENVNLKGFRPGKVPSGFLEDETAQEDLYNETINFAVKKTYAEVMKDESLEPIGKAEIEVLKIAPDNDFQYRLKTSILPRIKLGDYKDIAKKVLADKKKQKVKDNELDKAIDWLRKSRAEIIPVNRSIQKGDVVEIEIKTSVDGQILEGASHPEKFVLGEGHFLVGFEDRLIGLRLGDEGKFNLPVPSDYWDKKLQGKSLSFEVRVISVAERKISELTDDWAKSIGKFDKVEDLKKSIMDGLLYEKEMKEKDRIRIAMIEKISLGVELDLPDILLDNEVERRMHSLNHLAEDAGLTLAAYLQRTGEAEDKVKETLRLEAAKELKNFLVLREISILEECQSKDEEIERAVNDILKHYASQKSADKSVDRESVFEYAKERLTNEKVFQLLENLK